MEHAELEVRVWAQVSRLQIVLLDALPRRTCDCEELRDRKRSEVYQHWLDRYGLEIPVLMIDGRKVAKYRVTEAELTRMLDGRDDGRSTMDDVG